MIWYWYCANIPPRPLDDIFFLFFFYFVFMCGSDRIGPDRFGPRTGLVRTGSIRTGLVRTGSVRTGSVRIGSVRTGSVRFGPVRFVEREKNKESSTPREGMEELVVEEKNTVEDSGGATGSTRGEGKG